jgi:hypothetical protein
MHSLLLTYANNYNAIAYVEMSALLFIDDEGYRRESERKWGVCNEGPIQVREFSWPWPYVYQGLPTLLASRKKAKTLMH